jgi:hypothetical protein
MTTPDKEEMPTEERATGPFGGLSLRDYFAAQAISTMINKCEDRDGGWDPVSVAVGCYAVADALLEYRSNDELDLDPRTPEYGVGR